jgi:hypothetical protein
MCSDSKARCRGAHTKASNPRSNSFAEVLGHCAQNDLWNSGLGTRYWRASRKSPATQVVEFQAAVRAPPGARRPGEAFTQGSARGWRFGSIKRRPVERFNNRVTQTAASGLVTRLRSHLQALPGLLHAAWRRMLDDMELDIERAWPLSEITNEAIKIR